MQFNLAKLNNDTKIVSHNDEAFVGTPLANQPFSVEVKRLSRSSKIDTISSSVKEDGSISNGEYSKAIFISSISDVDGFTDENNQPLTLEDGVANIIWEYAPDILVETIKKVVSNFNEEEEKKSDSLEEDSQASQIGQ